MIFNLFYTSLGLSFEIREGIRIITNFLFQIFLLKSMWIPSRPKNIIQRISAIKTAVICNFIS